MDVAAAAGVSVSTVSKVINGRDGIASGTRQRVQVAVSELGFERSLVARSLRSQRTHVIGILVAGFEPFSAEILKGAATALTDTDYELLAYTAASRGGGAGWERRYLSRLGALIGGAVLVTPSVVDADAGIPLVTIDPHTGPVDLPSVSSDNHTGAMLATRHLIGLGHQRIGFLAGRPDLESSRAREAGYRRALADGGYPVVPHSSGRRLSPRCGAGRRSELLVPPIGPQRCSPPTTSPRWARGRRCRARARGPARSLDRRLRRHPRGLRRHPPPRRSVSPCSGSVPRPLGR